MPFVEREGAALYWEEHGSGSPVVFAHGAGGNTLIWWQQIPYFAARHRAILFDHRGFGRSRCAEADVDARHFPDDLLAILDAAKVERAALVCQSMGGFTGLRFAVEYPKRVSALVLAGTAGGAATPLVDRDHELVIERAPKTPRLEKVLAREFIRSQPELSGLYALVNALNPPERAESIGATLWRHRVPPAPIAALSVPTLLLVGTEDWFFRVGTISDLAARIPGARMHVFEGVGHSTYFEAPEDFNRIVGDFLAAIPG